MGSSRRVRWSAVALGLATSAAAAWLTIRGVEWSEIGRILHRVELSWLLLVPLLSIPVQLLQALRSRLLLGSVARLPLVSLVFSHILAFVGNTLFPMRAGELLRIDYLAREARAPHTFCLAIAAIERLFDTSFMIVCFFAGLTLSTGKIKGVFAIGLLAAVSGLALVATAIVACWPAASERVIARLAAFLPERPRSWGMAKVASFIRGFEALSSLPSAIAVTLITALRWILGMAGMALVLRAFSIELPWYSPVILLAFTAFGTAIPSTVAFAGTYHYAVVAGLAVLGVGDELAVSYAVVLHAAVFLPMMAVGGSWVAVALGHGSYRLPALGTSDPAPRAQIS